MDPISAVTSNMPPAQPLDADRMNPGAAQDPEKVAAASHQFEAILIRQFLSESMKPLLEEGPSGQVYGYLLTDSLAQTMSNGGGMGLSHILQAQFTK